MRTSSLFRIITLLGTAFTAGFVHAGTYSIVSGPDTSLLAGTTTGGGTCSWSASGSALILNAAAGASSGPGHLGLNSGTASITGEVYWIVRWTESYPGEPHPTSRSVGVNVTQASPSMPAFSALTTATAHAPGGSAYGESNYTSFDDFLPLYQDIETASAPPGGTYVVPYSSNGGNTTWSTGEFNEISSGVYEATITYTVNTNIVCFASGTDVPHAATGSGAVEIHMKYTIATVDGQAV